MSAARPATMPTQHRRADDAFPPLPVKRTPAYIAAETARMRCTLLAADQRALNRRFTGDALTDFGGMA